MGVAGGDIPGNDPLLPGGGTVDPSSLTLGYRLAAGAVLATVVAVAAHRAGALRPSGAVAAVVAGAIAAAAGWSWAILLVAYFVSTSILSHVGRASRAERTGAFVAKGGARDWHQVAANGGVFTAGAVLWLLQPHPGIAALAAGSLAAAAADSWATEAGTLVRRPPRSIITGRQVPPGTSGGVSTVGSAAMVVGSAFIAMTGLVLGWSREVATAAFVGGIAGAIIDSVLGATVQARLRCPSCAVATEQPVHRCGTASTPSGGVRWVDNDIVNLLCALGGGLLAALLVA